MAWIIPKKVFRECGTCGFMEQVEPHDCPHLKELDQEALLLRDSKENRETILLLKIRDLQDELTRAKTKILLLEEYLNPPSPDCA